VLYPAMAPAVVESPSFRRRVSAIEFAGRCVKSFRDSRVGRSRKSTGSGSTIGFSNASWIVQ
jgi:hypothetical protein